jgi:hypothetical protein
MGATATAPHPVTLNGRGNRKGATRYHVCRECNTRKAESQFRVYATGNVDPVCRKCRNRQTAEWKRQNEYRTQTARACGRSSGAITMPQDRQAIDPDTARAVWATILRHTIEQMRAPKPRVRADTEYSRAGLRTWARTRAEATCWLGSSRATPVFEMLGYDQEVHLPRIRWAEYARAVLAGRKRWERLAPDRVRLLEDGIAYFGGEGR